MAGKLPVFDYGTCMACELCNQACPLSCIALSKIDVDAYKKAYPVLLPEPHCTGCAICQKICPVDSIQIVE
jgi:formate hydrogenlyase subunit 6/NADH:ubiquinone oxidoreductase subunit I